MLIVFEEKCQVLKTLLVDLHVHFKITFKELSFCHAVLHGVHIHPPVLKEYVEVYQCREKRSNSVCQVTRVLINCLNLPEHCSVLDTRISTAKLAYIIICSRISIRYDISIILLRMDLIQTIIVHTALLHIIFTSNELKV